MRTIYGINPVLELLAVQSGEIQKILVAKGRGGQDLQKIVELSKKNHVTLEFRPREAVDALVGGKSQGVVALCKAFQYADLADVIANRHPGYSNSLILILDSVTDPQNLGSMIRTAYFFGANGVIIPENRAASVTATVVKASTGAVHHLPIAMVTNLATTLDVLKKAGYWIYGTDAHAGSPLELVDFNCDVGLVMGSEGAGLRALVGKKCDLMVSIPGAGDSDSLNVSVSAGILMNRIFTMRKKT